ncbi:MAG: translation elongation factor-like protein [Candidatus Aenigmarchaeota archaeon]|nr:translation elongation factor-like protein [Candidatus Aenigmarchaeota archaeon]
MGEKKLVGKVTHYYGKLAVAIVELEDDLEYGDRISIEGPSTNIEQTVDSMQIEHNAVKIAHKGDAVGLKVSDKVRPGDNVYKIAE